MQLYVFFLVFLQIILQFTLESEDPYTFVSHAPEFIKTLNNLLSKGDEFDDVNAVILGAAQMEEGISYVHKLST